MKIWKLSTDDTNISLSIENNMPQISEISGAAGVNWVNTPSNMKLPDYFVFNEVRTRPVWNFVDATERTIEDGSEVEFKFVDTVTGVEYTSCWTAHKGPGAIEHRAYIKNTSDKQLLIFKPESLEIALGVTEKYDAFYVSKDRAASEILSYVRSGYGTYREEVCDRYSTDIWTKPDDDDTGFIPLVMLQAANNGVYVGWVWNHGRIAVRGIEQEYIKAQIRAGQFDDFCTEIFPNEVFEVPMAFIGAYTGEVDDGSNRLRKYLFNHMMPEINRTNEKLPSVNWNAYYSTALSFGAWQCKEENYYPMVDALAKVGVEEVTIDVGWWEGYGDWRSNKEFWPRGMAAASQYTHDKGMNFTLYFTFTNSDSEDENALTAKGPNGHSEWFVDELKADLAIDECRQYVIEKMGARFDEYNVDALRTDYDPVVTRKAGGRKRIGINDGAYWAEKGFVEFLEHFYKTRPGFRYQNCSGGGALKGYNIMKRSSMVQVTDSFDALNMRKAVWDSAYCYPMMQIMTQFGDITCQGKKGHITYRMGTYLMAATSAHVEHPDEMLPEENAMLAKMIACYKEKIRPLVRYADVYHNLPRPDGFVWDGFEYYDPDTGKGLTLIFKPESEIETQNIKWVGLDRNADYKVSFFLGTSSNEDTIINGGKLMDDGIDVTIKDKFVAEWMFVEKI